MKVAIVVKSPSKFNFQKAFNLPDADVYHLTSNPELKRVLKKDVDIQINVNNYDYVILVGSEAVKNFTKVTALSDNTGRVHPSKDGSYSNFIVSISPAALSFKPELQQTFNETLSKIHAILSGNVDTNKIKNELHPILSISEATKILNRIKAELMLELDPVLAFDTETSSLYCRHGVILGMSLSHKIDFGTYIHSDAMTDSNIAIVQSMLDDPRINIVGHNARFDMHFTKYHYNLNFDKAFEEGRMHDTMVLHYLLNESPGTHGLKSLAMKYTDLGDYDSELDEFKKTYCKDFKIKESEFTYDLIPWDILSTYASLDTIATIRLFKKFHQIVMANEKLSNVYTTIMMPCIELLQEIEDNGVPTSLPRLYKARELLNKEIQESTKELYTYPSVIQFEKDQEKIFNPGSPLQLRTLLFDYEKLKPTGKLTNTGAISTDAEVLEQLSEKSQLARVILNIRKSTKLLNTFVEKMIDHTDNDGRLRTGFNATSTTSGRLSSSGTLNLQQLPSRGSSLIKGCIKARPGYRIVALDMSTAEVWASAAISKDPLMMQMFRDIHEHPELSADFHSLTAFNVFPTGCKSPLEVKSLAPHYRQASKSIVFSVLYGSGAQSLADGINSTLLEVWHERDHADPSKEPKWYTKQSAQELLDDYFSKFPTLKRWIDKVHKQIKDYGFVYSPFGRKRRLPNHKSTDKGVVAECLRSGLNAVPQGASSDIMVQAAINMRKRIRINKWDIKIIALVHDSIVMEVREDLVDIAEKNAAECIQKDYGLFIEGAPMGYGIDSEDGGSVDYSCGKFSKEFKEFIDL